VGSPGAALRLLLSLLDVDPAMRPTMHEALRSPVFHALRQPAAAAAPEALRYMHYYRGSAGSGPEVAAPPML
jgi:hypothetical protein